MADIQAQLVLSLREDFVDNTRFRPRAHQEGELARPLDEVLAWSAALAPLRGTAPAVA
jgi:hypothetical protein